MLNFFNKLYSPLVIIILGAVNFMVFLTIVTKHTSGIMTITSSLLLYAICVGVGLYISEFIPKDKEEQRTSMMFISFALFISLCGISGITNILPEDKTSEISAKLQSYEVNLERLTKENGSVSRLNYGEITMLKLKINSTFKFFDKFDSRVLPYFSEYKSAALAPDFKIMITELNAAIDKLNNIRAEQINLLEARTGITVDKRIEKPIQKIVIKDWFFNSIYWMIYINLAMAIFFASAFIFRIFYPLKYEPVYREGIM